MDKILYKMDNSNKIIIASEPEIDSIKLFVLSMEKKTDKTENEQSMLINAKMKLKALGQNEIVTK